MSTKTEPTQAEWQRMQKLVLQRLHAKYDNMSKTMRNLPTLHFQDPDTMEGLLVSPNDAVIEVEALSDVGKHIIQGVMKLLEQLQP